jgi:DNA-binding NtrC family response regulator
MNDDIKTILAIDDDITILTQIRTILEGYYEVSLAKNTDIAKKILNSTRVGLVLLDMNMPEGSGMDFLEQIHKDPNTYHIPVIIVSSEGTANVIIDSKKNGAVDFIVKPFSAQILTDKIKGVLKTARKKINKDSLLRKLKSLENACITGRSNQVEELVEDLELVYYDSETDTVIADICKFAKNMEYNLVDEKIKPLLEKLAK